MYLIQKSTSNYSNKEHSGYKRTKNLNKTIFINKIFLKTYFNSDVNMHTLYTEVLTNEHKKRLTYFSKLDK